MNQLNIITTSLKNKHLNYNHYEYIINSITKHDAIHHYKKRGTGRTALIKSLAIEVGTSVSNIYNIINASKITTLTSQLEYKEELSATAAFHSRSKKSKPSHNSKLESSKEFIDLVTAEVKKKKLSSIDETIHYLKLHQPELIKNMTTVCTKTFYNYVHQRKVSILPIDLPRMCGRKNSKNYKTYISKRQKGTCITERPFLPEDRSEFGHWEGDLVVGPRDGQHGAILTLIERKTRFYIMIPIKAKSSKQVYMQINKLQKHYGDKFPTIFKSITFDNGSEFSRHKDIEIKPNTLIQRTTVYFGRPYRSCDRGSNENCNGLIRYFIKKGTAINSIPKHIIREINEAINDKKRKILGYLPASHLFDIELKNIGFTSTQVYCD